MAAGGGVRVYGIKYTLHIEGSPNQMSTCASDNNSLEREIDVSGLFTNSLASVFTLARTQKLALADALSAAFDLL